LLLACDSGIMSVKAKHRAKLAEANLIARESLSILVRKCRAKYPEVYNFFMEEMDTSDEQAEWAAAMLDV